MDFVPETYTGFATARAILGSEVEYAMENVYNLTPEAYGRTAFDPNVPYLLDEEKAVHTVTPRRRR